MGTDASGKKDALYWINILELIPHPEGGCFREVYRSNESIQCEALPARYGGARVLATSIYFLLKSGDVSKFHRLQSDEVWSYHCGAALEYFLLEPHGRLMRGQLGPDPHLDQLPQLTVKAGCWVAARVFGAGDYSLCGCFVAPGFEFEDFQLADSLQLRQQFPEHADIIREVT